LRCERGHDNGIGAKFCSECGRPLTFGLPAPLPPPKAKAKGRGKTIGLVVGGVFAGLVALGAIGAIVGEPEGDTVLLGEAVDAEVTTTTSGPAAGAAPTTAALPPTTAAPTTTAPPPPPPTTAPHPVESASQRNARQKAEEYLEFMSFSRTGLINQLEFEGFPTADATYGVDALHVDWNRQAANKASEYLDFMSFSRSSLIEQLEFEGFTPAEAAYGVSTTGL
jgi:hypothetical protein